MTDITKCDSPSCPMREKCYRFTAPYDYRWQSMATFIWDSETGKCDHFLEIPSQAQPKNKFAVKKTIAVEGKKK